MVYPPSIGPLAAHLISRLLSHEEDTRLGSGLYGVEEIKAHPWFHVDE